MPRLFTGLELPAEVAERLSYLRGGLPGARWISAENYHVTLRFIGDVDMVAAEEIAEGLARIRRRTFTLRISALGAFGGRKPHAIVANVEPSAPLSELQAEHERLLQRLGMPPETRKFLPHVTVARLRNVSPRDVAEYLTLRGGFSAGPIAIDRFVLFSSRDSVGGGPYVVEEAYPLAEQAALSRS